MPFPVNFPAVRPEHELYEVFGQDHRFECRACRQTWKRKPQTGKCVGVPVFDNWSEVPAGLFSKTMLKREHKRTLPDDAIPVAAVRTFKSTAAFTPLYMLRQTKA